MAVSREIMLEISIFHPYMHEATLHGGVILKSPPKLSWIFMLMGVPSVMRICMNLTQAFGRWDSGAIGLSHEKVSRVVWLAISTEVHLPWL
jgi:hypothetical protein